VSSIINYISLDRDRSVLTGTSFGYTRMISGFYQPTIVGDPLEIEADQNITYPSFIKLIEYEYQCGKAFIIERLCFKDDKMYYPYHVSFHDIEEGSHSNDYIFVNHINNIHKSITNTKFKHNTPLRAFCNKLDSNSYQIENQYMKYSDFYNTVSQTFYDTTALTNFLYTEKRNKRPIMDDYNWYIFPKVPISDTLSNIALTEPLTLDHFKQNANYGLDMSELHKFDLYDISNKMNIIVNDKQFDDIFMMFISLKRAYTDLHYNYILLNGNVFVDDNHDSICIDRLNRKYPFRNAYGPKDVLSVIVKKLLKYAQHNIDIANNISCSFMNNPLCKIKICIHMTFNDEAVIIVYNEENVRDWFCIYFDLALLLLTSSNFIRTV